MPGDMKAYLERLQIGSFEAADSGRFSFEQVLNKSFWGAGLLVGFGYTIFGTQFC